MNETLLTVQLTWERWQQVLGLLGEVPAPLRVTLPLVQEIQQQCQKQLPQPNGAQTPALTELQHVPH